METQTNQVVELTRELIRAQSYSGQEKKAADVLARWFEALGFDRVERDEYGNTVGVLCGSRPGPCVLFDGHLDTVPVGNAEEWTHDPFAADIAGGRIYGRGASDMKGAVAAMACAAAAFASAANRDFAGKICVVGSVHEECFEGVASRSLSKKYAPDYVVIGEASQLNLKIGQRGRAEIVVETFGRPAHSSSPEQGVNAVYAMSALIEALRQLPPAEHPVLGKGILELTDIKSLPYPGASVVPAYCRATFDRRLLIGETRDSVLAPIKAVADRLSAQNPAFACRASFAVGRETCYTGCEIEGERFFPGWLYSADHAFVKAVQAELAASGMTPLISHYSFCTNGSHYAGEAGIKTLGIGPSLETLAHTIDEYIEIEQLERAVECYAAVMRALLR